MVGAVGSEEAEEDGSRAHDALCEFAEATPLQVGIGTR